MKSFLALSCFFLAMACGTLPPDSGSGSITSQQTANGDVVGSVVFGKVPSPDYDIDKSFIRVGVNVNQKVVQLEGYIDAIPGKVAAQRYVIYAGDPGSTIADIMTAFVAGQPKPMVPRILADELLIVVNETVLPVDRTVILQNTGEGGVSAYEFAVLHFKAAP